jgi:hypothetical protein
MMPNKTTSRFIVYSLKDVSHAAVLRRGDFRCAVAPPREQTNLAAWP